jgi:cystathionine beta-lyase
MNTYNFDETIPRRGTHSIKWDLSSDEQVLPMWVADMDFRTAPPILAALERRLQHGIFGYAKVPDAYYNAVVNWFGRRHHFSIQADWILPTIGVVPAMSAAIKALTEAGDQVIIQSPVYNCFFNVIPNNRCETVSNDLIYRNGTYSIDFDDLEQKASDPKAKVFLLCNPHNPAGRSWTREELQRMGDICLRHHVTVISDEIHCDLVYASHVHTPFASISDEFRQHSVTCTAPTKTFNIAGIQVANLIVADSELRNKVSRALEMNETQHVNVFGIEALIAAYNESEAWLDELKIYLYDNYLFLKDYFERYLPHLKVLPLEATYLAWVDCSALGISDKEIVNTLLTQGKLMLNEGSMYGDAGKGFIRINLACTRANVRKGAEIIRGLYGR